jgi:hypothetical protein
VQPEQLVRAFDEDFRESSPLTFVADLGSALGVGVRVRQPPREGLAQSLEAHTSDGRLPTVGSRCKATLEAQATLVEAVAIR